MEAYRRLAITFVSLFLTTSLALARDADGTASVAPAETVPMIYVVLFIAFFIGSIAWFFVYMWWVERKKKPDQ